MWSKVLLLAATLSLLASCAELERMNAEQEARQQAADQSRCTGFGFQPGSDAYANCMMTQDQNRNAQRAEQAQRDAEAKEREKDRQAAQRAADDRANQQHQEEIQRVMETGNLHPDMTMPKDSNCTTTTESTQTGNAGSMTSTTTCKH